MKSIKELEFLTETYFLENIQLEWYSIEEIPDFDIDKAKMDNFSNHISKPEVYETEGYIYDTQGHIYIDYMYKVLKQKGDIGLSKTTDLILELIHKTWSTYSFFLMSYYWKRKDLVDISLNDIVSRTKVVFDEQKELYPKSILREFIIESKIFFDIEFEKENKSKFSGQNFEFAKSLIDNEKLSLSYSREINR